MLDGCDMAKEYFWKESVNNNMLKLLRNVFEETRLRVAYFMFMSGNKIIKVARERELGNENS